MAMLICLLTPSIRDLAAHFDQVSSELLSTVFAGTHGKELRSKYSEYRKIRCALEKVVLEPQDGELITDIDESWLNDKLSVGRSLEDRVDFLLSQTLPRSHSPKELELPIANFRSKPAPFTKSPQCFDQIKDVSHQNMLLSPFVKLRLFDEENMIQKNNEFQAECHQHEAQIDLSSSQTSNELLQNKLEDRSSKPIRNLEGPIAGTPQSLEEPQRLQWASTPTPRTAFPVNTPSADPPGYATCNSMLCALVLKTTQLDASSIKHFDGSDPTKLKDYFSWLEALISDSRTTAFQQLTFLYETLKGEALEAVSFFGRDNPAQTFIAVKDCLKETFGHPITINRAYLQKLKNWEPIYSLKESTALIKLCNFADSCLIEARESADLADMLNTKETIRSFVFLFPEIVREDLDDDEYYTQRSFANIANILVKITKNMTYSRFKDLFLSSEERHKSSNSHTFSTSSGSPGPSSARHQNFISSHPPNTGRPSHRYPSSSEKAVHHHHHPSSSERPSHNGYPPTRGQSAPDHARPTHRSTSRRLCSYCQKPGHSAVSCCRFKALSIDEKSKIMSDYGWCFACLEPGHLARRCMKKTRCEKCFHWHPTIVHDVNEQYGGSRPSHPSGP